MRTDEPPSPATTALQQLRILIVDDDDIDRLAVRRCLQQSGIRVTTAEAHSADETLQCVHSSRYDCILLDYYLPEVNGLTLLEDIRAAAPETPVVIFTGRGDEDIAVELMKSGAADYLPKASLSPERIASGIRHALKVTSAELARSRAERLLRLLGEAAEHLLTAAEPELLVQGVFDRIADALQVDAYVHYFVADDGALRLASWAGFPDETASDLAESPVLVEAAASTRQLVHLKGIQESPDPALAALTALGVRSASCHPLLAHQVPKGYLCFASRSKDAFNSEELDFLKTVSHYVTAAFERLRHIQQLHDSDRRKDEFLATLSHELRDPLAPLRNMLEVVKRAEGDSDTLRAAHAAMERQLSQLEHLVRDLLDASRITQSRLTLRKRVVELSSIVQQSLEVCAPLAERAGHELHVSLPEVPIHLDADPVRLAQVLGNLLTNACKYTDRGGLVELTAARQRDGLVISVRDTGIGIPRENLGSVFDMFSQVHSAVERSEGGLGIGLTLVKRLVEMHGGSVEARSEGPGRGSEFRIRLPVLEDAPGVAEPASPEAPANAAPMRVLVVDDNRDSATSLSMLLRSLGHETEEAYDGVTAVEAAARFRPGLVFLDIGLPGLNGYEVCQRVRALPGGGDTVMVALTGWGQDDDLRRSRQAGFDHHVIKPVDFTSLTRLLTHPSRPGAE